MAPEAPPLAVRDYARAVLRPGERDVRWRLRRADAQDAPGWLAPGSFDLIYADPPFFSGRTLRGPGGHRFCDRWAGDGEGYLAWLEPRLAAMWALLAPTGSLFVHLDGHAVHAVKVALDRLCGRRAFINEIIWSYRTGGAGHRRLARKHDTILFYARTRHYKFHPLRERSDLAHRYGFANAAVQTDARGPYRMALLRDVWELPGLRGNMPERVPFPTQKPLALLRRIVALVTDPGDRVGDFFCGSGTTLVAACEAGCRAAGGDISSAALALAGQRLSTLAPAEPIEKEET